MAFGKRYQLICLCFVIILSGCLTSAPIRIGFVAELSGRNNVLGVQGRNGAQLAIDEINAGGGVAGRQLELLIYDDMGDANELLKVDQQLIDSRVVAISGHLTSWESISAIDLLARANMILFSPTTSSPDLSGKADNFFRLMPSNTAQAFPLAEYTYRTLNLKTAAVLYESDNAAFARTYADGFIGHFTSMGGEITTENGFSSSSNPDFAAIVRNLRSAGEAQALLIVASSVDTALLAQQIRLQDWQTQIITSNWAYTDDLLHNGGHAVNGILLTPQINNNCQTPAFLEFQSKFQDAYGNLPSFPAMFSYETIQVLATALEKTKGSRQGLEEAIIQAGRYEGLCDQIIMDAYGDVERTLYLSAVENGRFTLIKEFPPTP